MEKDEYDSEFCHVEYRERDNVVFLAWKKFCCQDDYRTPTMFALKLLEKHPDSNFVADARNGFEDTKEDVAWGFSVLLPAMSRTGCKHVAFILNEVHEIEEEMDMWTKEFMRYFTVANVRSYEDAVRSITR